MSRFRSTVADPFERTIPEASHSVELAFTESPTFRLKQHYTDVPHVVDSRYLMQFRVPHMNMHGCVGDHTFQEEPDP
jgi:hypothetical protein